MDRCWAELRMHVAATAVSPARQQSLTGAPRERVFGGESSLRGSPASGCCHAGDPRGGAGCTGSSAQPWPIDRGRSDLCSECQHGSQLLRLAFHAALLHCREKQPGARARTARWLWPPHSTQLLGSSALHAIILVCRIFPTHLGDSEWCGGSNCLFSTGRTHRIGVHSVRDGHVR